MRKFLLITTCGAAISAFAAFASAPAALAQADQQKHEAPGAERPNPMGQTEKRETGEKPGAQMKERRAVDENQKPDAQKSADEMKKPETKGAEPRAADAAKPDAKANEQRSADEVKRSEATSKEKSHAEEGVKPGAASKERRANDQAEPRNETGQAQERRTTDHADQNAGEKREDRTTASGGDKAPRELDARQTTEFRQRLQRDGRGHETNVRFDARIGAAVPADVTLDVLPTDLVEEYPEYRGYDFVMVQDEVVIVDPETRDVVEVVGGPPTTRAAAVNPCATND
jgi:hypothetical protein